MIIAQCTGAGICFAITESEKSPECPPGKLFVILEKFDETLLGKRWDEKTGTWEDIP